MTSSQLSITAGELHRLPQGPAVKHAWVPGVTILGGTCGVLVFLDESGDPGFKLDSGSSIHFVVSLVIFGADQDAEDTSTCIKGLRKTLGVADKFEFKFNKLDNSRRLQFLEAVGGCRFRIRAMVVDKRALHSARLRSDKESFYSFFVGELMKYNHGTIKGARLRIDGSGGRGFKKAFQTYLRRKVANGTIHNCKFVNSANDSLIQLADMTAGAIFRSYHPAKADPQFLGKLKHKLEDCWEFDKKNWPAS